MRAAGQHPCDVLSFNDKYMMLFYDRRFVTLKSGKKSCVPHELWDRDFYKFSSSRCIYCNGEFDRVVPERLGVSVVPVRTAPARWKPLGRKKQQTLPRWRVQKRVGGKVREATPDSIVKSGLSRVKS
jgi:hypothetical protein